MSPGRVRATVVADKAEVIKQMLAGGRTLPLASEAEFLADDALRTWIAAHPERIDESL